MQIIQSFQYDRQTDKTPDIHPDPSKAMIELDEENNTTPLEARHRDAGLIKLSHLRGVTAFRSGGISMQMIPSFESVVTPLEARHRDAGLSCRTFEG
jgi:hypothetical protein